MDSLLKPIGRCLLWSTSSLVLWSIATPIAAVAQIIPDATLPVNTVVTPQDNTSVIEGGTRAGGNLFHSFSSFSVPTGSTAFFNNSINIDNIISRVTGSNISNIDGLIRANGTANLFLLNPNGVIFGPNARLDIGGSFIGSTADSINFADGSTFSATAANAPPLLTVNLPVGLQWGSNSGSIVNRSRVTNSNGKTVGLQVQPDKTLALVGGDVTLEGGYLSAPEGRIELAGVGDNSQVNLTSTDNSLALEYLGVENFRDVQMERQASVDVSGAPSGSVQVRARTFRVSERSAITSFNLGKQPAGAININATELVELIGTGTYIQDFLELFNIIEDFGVASDLDFPSGLFSVTLGTGAGGEIAIDTNRLIATNGSFINATTDASGRAGDLTVNASSSVQLTAAALLNSTVPESTGDGGDITLNTGRLLLQEASLINTSTDSVGRGGDLAVNASESIELVGTNLVVAEFDDGTPLVLNTGLFAATTANSSGDAGEMRVLTGRLSVRNGAALVVNSLGEGRPGNLILTATESAEFIGSSPGAFTSPSSILATALPSETGIGGGNVTVTTGDLILKDEGTFTASNLSPGAGGSIEVVADSILLDNEASIEAETAFGEGGNIRLRTQQLQLRNNSNLTVTAGNVENPVGLPPEIAAFFAPLVTSLGDGGNIIIETDTLVALENSDIAANAQEGFGGQVNITAQGIFGAAFREAQTPESDITATSALGAEFAGVVEIRTPEVDTSSALIDLPENVTDSSQQITPGCVADAGNTFTIAGRGGLPEDPVSGLRGRAVWWDGRDLSRIGNRASLANRQSVQLPQPTMELVEATGLVIYPDGRVELVAQLPKSANPWHTPANCQRHEANRQHLKKS